MRELTHAKSFKNGIIFFSNYNKNYGSKATINKEGKIDTQWSKIIENEPKIENPEEVTLIYISKTFFR